MTHSEADNNKPALEGFVENIELGQAPKQLDEYELYSRAEQKKIIRQVDFRVIFPLGLMLAVGFLDRGNVGNAAIAG